MKFNFSVFFLFILFISAEHYAQLTNIVQLPNQNPYSDYINSYPINISSSEVIVVYLDYSTFAIKMMRSSNSGLSWQQPVNIIESVGAYSSSITLNLAAIRLTNGRIVISWREYDGINYYIYSDNNGLTWSEKSALPTGASSTDNNGASYSQFFQTEENTVTYFYTNVSGGSYSIYYISSSINDFNWSERKAVVENPSKQRVLNVSMVSVSSTDWICTYRCYDSLAAKYPVYLTKSVNGGNDWTTPVKITDENESIQVQRLMKKSTGELVLIYSTVTETIKIGTDSHFNYDIVYKTSSNNGENWSGIQKFTSYLGYDVYFNTSIYNDKIAVSFSSGRGGAILYSEPYYSNYYQMFFGILNESTDNFYPPIVRKIQFSPMVSSQNPFAIQLDVVSNTTPTVKAKLSTDGSPEKELILYDDGKHQDRDSNDNVYGAVLAGMITPIEKEHFLLEVKIEAENQSGIVKTESIKLEINPNITTTKALCDVNKFVFPFDNAGIIAAVNHSIVGSGGKYEDKSVLFSGGFLLSGYANGELWVNGVASASLIQDFVPGPINSSSSLGLVYIVRDSDVPFGLSWIAWKNAVADGASYYDGDNDGVYKPVDKNSNGIWDTNEDRPDILGDYTAWCIYNDAVPSSMRRYNDVNPQKIEIQQTLFGWKDEGNPLENVVFVRYRIENKNSSLQLMESVYFGIWADPDIGKENNDLSGCDVDLSSFYSYNNGIDDIWGNTPPVFLMNALQGPHSFIPGVTFTDVNGDGKFTTGTDIPLDTAYEYNGQTLGIKAIPGAKNIKLSSFINYMQSSPILGDPDYKEQARNYMLGKDAAGNSVDPCTWQFGNVFNIPCQTVDNAFWYSGDPVTNNGWINNYPYDQRILGNIGPFNLEYNKPVEVIVAYVVGKGDSHLNSITVAKSHSAAAAELYNSNFNKNASPGADRVTPITTNELGNNYPNPFNPLTKISYKIENAGHVTIKIYDVLGKEVALLVNQQKEPGIYSVEFNGSHLASGIYFYELRVNQFRQIKKMLLVR
jgi:hypothetical protein